MPEPTMNHRAFLAAVLTVTCLGCWLHAQSTSLSSGDVTVRIIQGLDSASGRPRQFSAATVVSSNIPGVPRGSSAVVQLVTDSPGGFAVQLVRLGVNGQIFNTASSTAELAGGLFGKANKVLRGPGQPQDSVSGARVFLPQGTDVRFTLTEPTMKRPLPPQEAAVGESSRVAPQRSTQPRTPFLSKTSWTAYPDSPGIVPDAALVGEVPLMNGTDARRDVVLLLGCDDRNGVKSPVFRLNLPHEGNFNTGSLTSVPAKRPRNGVILQFDIFSSTDDELFYYNRMPHISAKNSAFEQIQYDADPREMGAFAAPQNAGKEALFRIGLDITYKVPAPNPVLMNVISACGVKPYAGSDELAPKYVEALLAATEAIRDDKKTSEHKVEDLEALTDVVITKPEWFAYQDLGRFESVVTSENAKLRGRPAPLRRKRCADAFVAQFKTGMYKSLPAACAYVAQQEPE